jgi:hypothetical protein
MTYSYDQRTARAPRLPRGKWELDNKTLPNEEAALRAAMQESRRSGRTVKIYEKGDVIAGVSGVEGYSVTVKRITRKGVGPW